MPAAPCRRSRRPVARRDARTCTLETIEAASTWAASAPDGGAAVIGAGGGGGSGSAAGFGRSAVAAGGAAPAGSGDVAEGGGFSTTTPWPLMRTSTVCCFRTASRRACSAKIHPVAATTSSTTASTASPISHRFLRPSVAAARACSSARRACSVASASASSTSRCRARSFSAAASSVAATLASTYERSSGVRSTYDFASSSNVPRSSAPGSFLWDRQISAAPVSRSRRRIVTRSSSSHSMSFGQFHNSASWAISKCSSPPDSSAIALTSRAVFRRSITTSTLPRASTGVQFGLPDRFRHNLFAGSRARHFQQDRAKRELIIARQAVVHFVGCARERQAAAADLAIGVEGDPVALAEAPQLQQRELQQRQAGRLAENLFHQPIDQSRPRTSTRPAAPARRSHRAVPRAQWRQPDTPRP